MKKFLLSIFIVLGLVSCEDIQTNEFAMQAEINNRLYQSTDARATVDEDGFLVINGTTPSESLTLRLGRFEEGNFNLGPGRSNIATYEDMNGNIYSTKPIGGGMVTISELNMANKTLSGIFHFHGTGTGIDTVYVSKGVLYNIPFTGGTTELPGEAGNLSAKVDGQLFLPQIVTAMESGNSIIIMGSSTSGSITITVPADAVIGAFSLTESGFSATYANAEGMQETSEGTISIAEHDLVTGSLKGSFSFITDRSEITEGQFEIIY